MMSIIIVMINIDIPGVVDQMNKIHKIHENDKVPNVTFVPIQYSDVKNKDMTNETHQDIVKTNVTLNDDIVKVPNFDVTLWNYSAKCSKDNFLGSCEPQKYIMPKNEVVQFVSSLMTISENGKLLWNKCAFEECGIFSNHYVTDDEQFNNPPNGDYWINADYYFLNGLKGDCEDSAFAVASVLEVKGVRTKIVGGYTTNHIRDWAVEYKINGTYFRYYGGVPNNFGNGAQEEIGFSKRNENVDFSPVLMFDKNSYYQDYTYDW